MTFLKPDSETQAASKPLYLRIDDLHPLRHQPLQARSPVAGRFTGRHATRQRGQSVEFSDYREYVPGDAVSEIDWKVYGRSDRLYIKRFEHQADMTVSCLIDASASMGFAGIQNGQSLFVDAARHVADRSWLNAVPQAGRRMRAKQTQQPIHGEPGTRFQSKYDHACLMPAAISFLAVRQQDRVALGVAAEGLSRFHPPTSTQQGLDGLLRQMERMTAGSASLAKAVEEMGRRVPRRGLFLLFSDLMDEPGPIVQALSALACRGVEVTVFQVLHPDELALPQLGDAVLVDSESGERVRINTQAVRAAYTRRLEERLAAWGRLTAGRRIHRMLVRTDTSYVDAVGRFLRER